GWEGSDEEIHPNLLDPDCGCARAECGLPAGRQLAGSTRCEIEEKSSGRQASGRRWRKKAVPAQLRRMPWGRRQWGSEKARCGLTTSPSPEAERRDALLENYQRQHRSRHAFVQQLA